MLLHKAYRQTNLEQIPENGNKKTKTFSNKPPNTGTEHH